MSLTVFDDSVTSTFLRPTKRFVANGTIKYYERMKVATLFFLAEALIFINDRILR